MSRDLSLMPQGQKNAGATMPSGPALRIVVICLLVLGAALLVRWQVTGQLSSQQKSLNEAKSQQQQLALRSQAIRNQLGALQTAGGASRIDLVKGLTKARVDWKKILLTLAQDSSPGIIISSVNATAPVAPGEEGDSTGTQASDIQMSGEAASREQLQAFVKRLRANKKIFLDVQLRKASAEAQAEPDPNDPQTQEAPAAEKILWEMGLTLAPIPPMPPNGSSGEGQ